MSNINKVLEWLEGWENEDVRGVEGIYCIMKGVHKYNKIHKTYHNAWGVSVLYRRQKRHKKENNKEYLENKAHE